MKANFTSGQKYTSSEIEAGLGTGTYFQVVVLTKSKGVIGIRFKASLNPNWKSRGEIWIHQGEKRVDQAQKWVNEKSIVPIFCSEKGSNSWTYLGTASASVFAVAEAAVAYTKDKRVGLVLKMDFKVATLNSVKTIRRPKSAPSIQAKRAA